MAENNSMQFFLTDDQVEILKVAARKASDSEKVMDAQSIIEALGNCWDSLEFFAEGGMIGVRCNF